MKILAHTNLNLPHQVRNATAFVAGIPNARITGSPNEEADLHIVQGPWFCLERWRHSNTLYFDRAFWGDPDSLSVHWLENGEKRFDPPKWDRPHPELSPRSKKPGVIYLCDYGEEPEGDYDAVRYHPAQKAPERPLSDDLRGCGVARGNKTTALVDAAIQGLRVESPYHRFDRPDWMRQLAWHNWTLDEIARGDMWKAIQSLR